MSEQSASLPGSAEFSSALLRRVSSRAFRAAGRARAAETAFVMICLASVGFSSRNSASFWLTTVFDEALDRRVAELRLRLALELRVAELDGDHGGETLADVLALELLLLLLQEALVARVAVERARQRRAEAGEVRPALARVDVVREREDRLDVGRVPLHRDLDLAVLVLALEVDDVLVDRVLAELTYETKSRDPALVVELLRLPARPLVAQRRSGDRASGTRSRAGAARASRRRTPSPRRSRGRGGTRSSSPSPSSCRRPRGRSAARRARTPAGRSSRRGAPRRRATPRARSRSETPTPWRPPETL